MKNLGIVIAAVQLMSCATTRCRETTQPPPHATAFQLTATDEVCLQAFKWQPAPEVRGVVVVIHGLRDHASRYQALAEALTARGFLVIAHDLRGHGHSGGARQRFDSMDQLLSDVDLLTQSARAQYPGKPVFLYGHSLGGLIATHYTLAHQAQLAGLVLSGAGLKLPSTVTSGQITAARFFGTVLPGLPAQSVDDDGFVSTAAAKTEFLNDPLIEHGNLPAKSAKTGIEAIEAAAARNEELTIPLLIMHAGDDRLTNVEGSRELHRRAKSSDKTLRIWEHSFHDLLHEPEREQVITEVVSWIEAHTR